MISGDSIKNIIFDLGGVILNIDYNLSINAFKELGIANIEELYTQASQAPFFNDLETGKIEPDEFFELLDKKTGLNLNRQEAIIAWNRMLLDLPEERIRLLKELKKHYRLFLLSNTNEIHIKEFKSIIDGRFGVNVFEEIFEKVYYSCRINCRKPDKEIFLKVLEENDLEPTETLFIDDSYQHIEGANSVGIKAYHLKNGKTIIDLFSGDFLVKNLN